MGRIAELESQVEEAQETASEPEPVPSLENRFAAAQFFEPANGAAVSAGGDEEPPLGSPQPATEADQEASTDFAAEMVDPTAAMTLPTIDVEEPPAVEEIVEPQTPAASEPAEAQPLIKSPVLRTRPKPRYPVAAMRLGKEAVVSLRLLIGANGKVVDVERLGPDPGMGFSKAAIQAALATQWEPATRDGEPIEMWTEMRIAFKP
jgi:protein TonB